MITFPDTRPFPTPEDSSVLRAYPSQQYRRVQLDQRQDNPDGSTTAAGEGKLAGSQPSILQLGPDHLAYLRAYVDEAPLPELPITDKLSRMVVLTGTKVRALTRLVSAEETESGGLHMKFGSGRASQTTADVYLILDDIEFLLSTD